MDTLASLQSLGLTLPSPAYLAGAIGFGIVGSLAYRNGKKTERPRIRWLGLALMLYPYAVSSTLWLYLVGAGLSVAIYLCRDETEFVNKP